MYVDICSTLPLSANSANISRPLDDDHVEYVVVTQLSEDSHSDNDSGVQTGRLNWYSNVISCRSGLANSNIREGTSD